MNLPWTHTYCGYDFGPPPPGWRSLHPSPRDFEAELGPTFDRLAALGVSVVRVFVLADCVAYPEPNVYRALLRVPREGFEVPASKGRPALPSLSPATVEDVRALLDAAHARGLQVIPSLLSFEAFAPPKRLASGIVKQGRGALILGDRRRHDEGAVAAFLDAALDPLLALRTRDGAPHPAVLAWEVANEPDWCVRHDHVSPEALDGFLGAAVRRVVEAGQTASIGFVRAEARFVPKARLGEWAELARAGRYLHQLHHYPQNARRPLPPADATAFGEATIVGEFPLTDRPRPGFADPELAASERDPDRYLLGRLELTERRGYRLALAWSLHAQDANSGLDAGIERQLVAFTRG